MIKWSETVLGIVVLVLAIWPTQIVQANVSRWVTIIAAVLIIILALMGCRNCNASMPQKTTVVKHKSAKKSSRKKKKRR